MNITQFLELQVIGIAGGAIHKTIAMLRPVTTQVRDKKNKVKKKINWKRKCS